MSEQEPVTKIGSRMAARINLGDYNHAEFEVWVEDRVRPTDSSTGAALDRLAKLLDAKLDAWARGLKHDAGTE
jgi:hypothetical protein